MKPTLPWMAQTFNEYNNKYFAGAIPTPRFNLRCKDTDWGHYEPDGYVLPFERADVKSPGILSLNGNYSRLEKDWIGTLLHEMIHMYIITVMRRYPKNPHGELFQEIASRLNGYGWNISELEEKKSTDNLSGDGEEDTIDYNDMEIKPKIFCLIESPHNENNIFWGFRAEYNDLNSYIATAKKLKQSGAETLRIYFCYSVNLGKVNASSTTLDGFGANNIPSILHKFSTLINEKLDIKNFRLYKEIIL